MLSLNWQASGGGAFALIPLSHPGKLPDLYPVCRGHTSAVLDTAFSPFDGNFAASGGDDGQICLWNVTPEQVAEKLDAKPKDAAAGDFQPKASFHGGRRRVGQVEFHPTASGVLAAATGEPMIKLFDLETQKAREELRGFTDSIQSMTFDATGSAMAATCRDRKLRLFDTRSPSSAQTVDSHGGIKGARAVWCGDQPRLITTGFSRLSERQLFLWDVKQLSKPVKTLSLDSSNGIIMPFWSDNGVCYLAGKGDGNIRYYELESDELHYLTEYKSIEPQSGMAFLPRRALNVDENEIARAYKVTNSMIQPVSFCVPRKADSFQSDLYPPAPAAEAAMSADDFFDGKTLHPVTIDLQSKEQVKGGATKPTELGLGAAATPDAAASTAERGRPLEKPAASTHEVPAAEPSAAAAPSSTESRDKPTECERETANESPAKSAPIDAEEKPGRDKDTLVQSTISSAGSTPKKTDAGADKTTKDADTREEPSAKSADPPAALNGVQRAHSADYDKQIEDLKAQVAERDARIRELELESLKYVQRRPPH